MSDSAEADTFNMLTGRSRVMPDSEEEVLEWIETRREKIADFVIEFCNIPSPRGREKEASGFLHEWFRDAEIRTRKQLVTKDRPNVIAKIGDDVHGGDSLLLNAHIDTSTRGPTTTEWGTTHPSRIASEAWREGDYLFGDGVANDKGLLSALAWAGRALHENEVSLANTVYLAGVVGETAGATVDEFQNADHLGIGIGSRRLLDGGIVPDYALVAETTDYAIGRMECGLALIKITINGRSQYIPRMESMDPENADPSRRSALSRATNVVRNLERWAVDYRERNTEEYGHGIQRASAGIGAIRAGAPQSPVTSPGFASIYLCVMLPAEEGPNSVLQEIEDVLTETGVEQYAIEPYAFRRGYVADDEKVQPLVDAISTASQDVRQAPPSEPQPAITSMWRDINVFNEVGVPAVTFGPPRSHSEGGNQCLHIDDIIDATKLYATTARTICGVAGDS